MAYTRSSRWTAGVLLAVLLAAAAAPAGASWWIFGKGEGKPEITRVFAAGLNLDEATDGVKLSRESLEGGEVVIKGFTSKSGSPIALAEVSLDGGVEWKKADLAKNGVFLYRFKPEPEKAYTLAFRIVDSSGKKNDPADIPARALAYKDVSVAAPVREAFEALLRAYGARDRSAFMDRVSRDFRGDATELENALEEDFRRYTSITVDPQVDTLVATGQEAKVSFRFNWRATAVDSGAEVQPLQDNTALTFRQEGEAWKLIAMAPPVIFGISRGSRIATGAGTGNAHDAEATFTNQETGEGGTVTLQSSAPSATSQGFVFATQQVSDVSYGSTGDADMAFESNIIKFPAGAGGAAAGSSRSAPLAGYSLFLPDFSTGSPPPLAGGQSFFIKTQDGKYALITIIEMVADSHLTFSFKYRADGGRDF